MNTFELAKYLGVWYELMHYPSWFQRNDNYNTTAEYTLNADKTIKVHNSSMANGVKFESFGTAKVINGPKLRVDFPMPEIAKLAKSGQFIPPKNLMQNVASQFNANISMVEPNYVVDRIWTNHCGEYVFAVVTDSTKQSLYVLSRYRHPSLIAYNEIMQYVTANYNRDKLVQTPHYE